MSSSSVALEKRLSLHIEPNVEVIGVALVFNILF